jgi:hypothetical protein
MDTSTYGILRGIKVPKPSYMKLNSSVFSKLQYYTDLKLTIPSLKVLFDLQDTSDNISLQNPFVIENIEILNNITIKGNCILDIIHKNKIQKIESYLKVTHLLDPVQYIKGEASIERIDNPNNQAYVETVASWMLGKLRYENISPHFNLFYGAFSAKASKYNYNVTDEIETHKMYKWFWENIENKNLEVYIEGDDEDIKKELYDDIMNKPDYCLDNDNDTVEELDGDDKLSDLESIHSMNPDSISDISSNYQSSEYSSEEEDEEDDYNVYLTFQNFPVMMIVTEKNVSTLDDLLTNYDEVGAEPGEQLWEEKWCAWLFQVIAALCVAQTLFGFTHNDLHSNNIVWSETDELYIYYKMNNGTLFKVPTYGKIFKIIDFGRSIFSINDMTFISDDFEEGNDAATQYNFSLLNNSSTDEPTVYPNPSFDLTRLSISIFESIFPEKPDEIVNGVVLSSENSRIIKETKSDLFNILWTWLIDIEGNNILWNDESEERFPDFELYVHISGKCKNAIPKEQLHKKPFTKFIIKSIPNSIKNIYSLFC